jgi:hypothetical protein
LRFEGVIVGEGGAFEETGCVDDRETAVVLSAFGVVEEVLYSLLELVKASVSCIIPF